MFTVHFAVTASDLREGDFIFVTGNHDELGNWEPSKALKLIKNHDGIFTGVVALEGVQKLNFRYFIAYYLHVDSENEEMIIRKWETHLHSRCVLPAVEATKNGICRAKVNDIFGFHGGREMVSDGWLGGEQQNAIHLRIYGEALKFYKNKHIQQEYKIKVVPLDLRNWDDAIPHDDDPEDAVEEPTAPIMSYSLTEIAALSKDEPKFRLQDKFGEVFRNGIDYFNFRTFSVAVEYLGFRIEVYKPHVEEPKLIAIGHALPSTMPSSFGKSSVPLLFKTGTPVGKIYFDYLFIRPARVPHPPFKMDISYIKHWKKRSTLEVGHRGMGNSYTKFAAARENTLHSLNSAAKNGADYVEFDVQLTKDKIPVIFHDFHVMVSVAKRFETEKDEYQLAVKDLKLEQLRLLYLDHVKHSSSQTMPEQVTKVTGHHDEAEEYRPFPTLVEALTNVSKDVGFNVEIKFPMVQIDGVNECENYFEHNEFVDAILKDVFTHASTRRIVFSSFDPDVCMMIAAKQNKYPVLFLCCGADTRHLTYQDPRTRTSLTAVDFAAGCGIIGVNFHSQDVLRDPSPIIKSKQLGLISFVWGDELNDKQNVEYFKKTLGVDGVIYDRIGESECRSNVFVLEKARKSELFAKKSSPTTRPKAISVNSVNIHDEKKFISNDNQRTNFESTFQRPVDWPIPSNSSFSRKSPTAEDGDQYFSKNHNGNMIKGYLPQQLTTAKEI